MHVQMSGITKRFGETLANDGVTLGVAAGEVLALLGENGAGKSTLMKILYGFYGADSGDILIDGNVVRIASPRDAMAAGIGMVFQHFSVIPALTVRENLLLAHPHAPAILPASGAGVDNWVGALKTLAPDLDPDSRVSDISVGQMQLLELAKVLNLDAKVVILDEPTSVLTPLETLALYGLIRKIADEGRAVILITHKFEDVVTCADRVAVLRQGRLVAEQSSKGMTADGLATLMVGGGTIRHADRVAAPVAPLLRFEARAISSGDAFGSITDVAFQVGAGEIFGIAGVSGSGQDILADCLAGVRELTSGDVLLDGVAVQRGGDGKPDIEFVGYIPERPLQNATAADLDLRVNLYLKKIKDMPFWLKWGSADAETARLLEEYDVRPRAPRRAAGSLSGGNLQKLVSARELSGPRKVVIACYPTMGLDIGATQSFYRRLFAHAEQGAAVIWISEDLDDLMHFAHRIAVIFNGKIIGTVTREEADRNTLGRWMMGAAA